MELNKTKITINCDFDGTCVTHNFPDIGKNIGAQPVLKRLVENGHGLILFTMRCDHVTPPVSDDLNIIAKEGSYLTNAVNWFKENDIDLYGIQKNPTQESWTSSPKSYAMYSIDDNAIGCPLLNIPSISDRPFVDWCTVAELLWARGLLTDVQTYECIKMIEDYFLLTYNYDLNDYPI